MVESGSDIGAASPAARRTSRLAIGSILSSLVVCCPVTTILGPLLGGVALKKIGADPALRGRGLAMTGIALGLIFTILQALTGLWLKEKILDPTNIGPLDALTAGPVVVQP